MSSEIVQQQNLNQEQAMTHHQIQALEILFSPVLELSQIISTEIAKNPVLEVDSEKYEPLEIEAISNEEMNKTNEKDTWIEQILNLQNETRTSIRDFSSASPESEEQRRHFLDSLSAETTMQQFLKDQLIFLNLDEEMNLSCETVISGLDDDGYLTSHPADLAMVTGQELSVINEAIQLVKTLEPAGICATDLRERLLLQLQRQGHTETNTFRVIDKHFDLLAQNKLPNICKSLQLTMTEMHQVQEEIQSLSPRITDKISVKEYQYIKEEVRIEETTPGELKATVLNNRLPQLRISSYYKKLLEDPKTTKDVQEYIKAKINGGLFLINSLNQRQSTIEKISQVITKYQKGFFLRGTNHLKPLTMNQVAEECGVHETTVSRTVSGKFLRCKYGIFPLRFFFAPGYRVDDGSTISNAVVKQTVKDLIERENPKSPLSDSKLAEMLASQGLTVARRTVAKYRESLAILPSNLRRKF